MTLERVYMRRRTLLVGGVAWVFGGCTTADQLSICTAQVALAEGIQRWRARAPPKDQAVIDELMERKDLLVHAIFGELPETYSRGAASSTTSAVLSKQHCLMHPKIEGGQPKWDWDLIYDPKLADKWEKKHRIPNPIEALLHHEIFGHILPMLRDPTLPTALAMNPLLWDILEQKAVAEENRYRRHLGLPEVPPVLPDE